MNALQVNAPEKTIRKTQTRAKIVGIIVVICLIIALVAAGYYYMIEAPRLALFEAYPIKYDAEIFTAAKNAKLDPELVFAIVLNESSFRPGVVSSVGAIGLMQVMPETGKWIAGKLGEEGTFKQDMLYQPEHNLRYGCWYLSYLGGLFNSDKRKMIAAYHAGQGSVSKWLNDPQYSPDGFTLQTIPFPTTAKYVEKVLTAYDKYKTLYNFDKIALELMPNDGGAAAPAAV